MLLTPLECRGLSPAGYIIQAEASTTERLTTGPHASWKRTSQAVSLSRLDNLHGHSASQDCSRYPRKECSTGFRSDAESKEKKRLPRLLNPPLSSLFSPFRVPFTSESSLICLKTGTSYASDPNRE
jgi:hypothetical protein